MRKNFFIALVIFCMTFATAFAEENIPTISVNGEGIVATSPDCATISVGVVSRNKDASKVQQENAKIAADIIRSAVSLGVDKKNIRTGNYNFQQVFHYDSDKKIFDGYEVANSVTIFVEDLNSVGKIIDAALSHGANNIDSLNFGLKNKSAVQQEALRLAVRDARAKAEIVAAELGKNIIGVRSVSINSNSVMPRNNFKMAMVEASDMAYETPIESGSLNCSASVHVEFEISR